MGTELAKIKNIEIKNIKFRKSGAEYTVDKANHALYKGIASIKFCNAQIANDLLELATNRYNNFTEVLADVNWIKLFRGVWKKSVFDASIRDLRQICFM